MIKIRLLIPLLMLYSCLLSVSCEKKVHEQDEPIAAGLTEVRGNLIDIRKWIAGEKLFPQHNAYKIPDNAADLFENSKPLKYAVGLMESAGPVEVRSGQSGVVVVAVDADNMPSEYVPTGKSFTLGDIIYYLYELHVTSGKWFALSKPEGSRCSTIVFAEELSVQNTEIPGKVIARVPVLREGAIDNVSMAILPDNTYIASCTGASEKERVSLFQSEDGGETWHLMENTNVSQNGIGNCYNLFVHNSSLYMMGVGDNNGNVLVSKSDDNGETWTIPVDNSTGIIKKGLYYSSAVPVAVGSGRIWRAVEEIIDGKKCPLVLSAPENADLLKESSWTSTNTVQLGDGFNFKGQTITELIEGNMVSAPDGRIFNLLRASSLGTSAAGVALPVTDVVNLAKPNSDWLITFPGGGKKFTVRYDSVSNKYWAITNPAGSAGMKHNGIYSSGITYDLVRNRMVLMYSKDLATWVQYRQIVADPDPFFHGFQYVDWQFDGDDIVAVCRMACPEHRGLPIRQLDANLMTFFRIGNFRNLD